MASISVLVLDFILSVIVFFGGGWAVYKRAPDGMAVSASNVAALILMILLFLQVMKIIQTCGQ